MTPTTTRATPLAAGAGAGAWRACLAGHSDPVWALYSDSDRGMSR